LTIFVAVVTSVLIYFQTSHGKKTVKNFVVSQMHDSIGIELSIGRLRGDFFRKIILDDIIYKQRISDKYIVTITSPKISIKFWMWKIFNKKPKIDEISFVNPDITVQIFKKNKQKTDAKDIAQSSGTGFFSHIEIKKLLFVHGKIKANIFFPGSSAKSAISARVNGQFKIIYPGKKSYPDVNISFLDINMDTINENFLTLFIPQDVWKDIYFTGKTNFHFQGDLSRLKITGDMGVDKFKWKNHEIIKSGLFLKCEYQKDKLIKIDNIGIDLNGNQLLLEGNILLNRPEPEYNLNLKLTRLNLPGMNKGLLTKINSVSPLIFSLSGKGFKKNNIESEGKCIIDYIDITQDLKLTNLLIFYKINREGFFINKAVWNSSFGEGEMTFGLENFRNLKMDFTMNNLTSQKKLKLVSGENLSGAYKLKGIVSGTLDSTKGTARIEVQNFSLDSTRMDSLKGELVWADKKWKLDCSGENIYYTNLFSKEAALRVELDTTSYYNTTGWSDKHVLIAFKLKKNKFPKNSVELIKGNLEYYSENLTFRSVSFRDGKNLAVLNGNFFIDVGKKALDKNKKWVLDFSINNMDLEIFKPFLPKEISKMRGHSTGEIYVRGTPKSPFLYGDFKVVKGEFHYPGLLKTPL
ncbi:hypothetical protein HY745_05720, partial [Candidatus Desantisbacteria bacterium]|nr:hypothetical protein [Candidatus Desantisbacteria bacterium]